MTAEGSFRIFLRNEEKRSFGIRNVAKLAVEYLLDLDVIENEKRRIQLSDEANRIRADWRSIRELLSQIASQVCGILMTVPAVPVAVLPDEPWIAISGDGEDIIALDKLLVAKRSLLIESSREETTEASGSAELGAKLEAQENTLLVAQARLFALRIDPPVPISPTRKPPDEKTIKNQSGRRNEKEVMIIKPDPPPRFDLIATVLYESAPEKSLALFQSGNKQQWFRPGETVDRYQIQEIRNGRVLISQPGKKLQEMFVPPKSNRPLLKDS